MKFKCNNSEWNIKTVDEATINNEMKVDGTLGVTIYKIQEILLLENQANIIKTLKHELMHVWLYEYGHSQDDDSTYKCEDVCEIVASSNEFINEVVNLYKSQDNISYEKQLSEIANKNEIIPKVEIPIMDCKKINEIINDGIKTLGC